MKNKLIKLLALVITAGMLIGLYSVRTLAPEKAYAESGAVCHIYGADGGFVHEYEDFEAALTAAADGQTIKLLDNIDYNKSVVINNKRITFDVNGHVLNITVTAANGTALTVNGGEALLADSAGGGKLNVESKGKNGRGLAVTNGSAEVSNAVAPITYTEGSNLISNGKNSRAVTASGAGAYVVIGGNAAGGHYAVEALNGATVHIKGDAKSGGGESSWDMDDRHVFASGAGTAVTVDGNTLSNYDYFATYGLEALNGAHITVKGNNSGGGGLIASGAGVVVNVGGYTNGGGAGIIAEKGAIVNIGQNVYGESGVLCITGSKVTIEGKIVTTSEYINFEYYYEQAFNDYKPASSKTGYLEYNYTVSKTGVTSYVWVKIPVITITKQPQDVFIADGVTDESLICAAVVSDGSKPSYQWYANDTLSNEGGYAIAGATGGTYALPKDLSPDGGPYYYYCVVSAAKVTPVISDAAKVTFGKPVITISVQPEDIMFTEGTTSNKLICAAEVSNGAAPDYQWYANALKSEEGGLAVEGAANSEFILPDTLTEDGSPYYYYCVVSAKRAESVTSDVAAVTVTAPLPGAPPTPISVKLDAKKIVTGDGAILSNNQFEFAVYDGDKTVASGKNDGRGSVRFSLIEFCLVGTYDYIIKETSADGNGWLTDKAEYGVTVEITDEDNVLTAEIIYPDGESPVFNNVYIGGGKPGDGDENGNTGGEKKPEPPTDTGGDGNATGGGDENTGNGDENTDVGDTGGTGDNSGNQDAGKGGGNTGGNTGGGVITPGPKPAPDVSAGTPNGPDQPPTDIPNDHVLAPNDNGGYWEIDRDGRITGVWTYDKVLGHWKFDAEVPAAGLLFTDDHIWYIRGYEDDTIRPEANITRAEVAMVFYRLLNPEFKKINHFSIFTDVSEDDWYGEAVNTLAYHRMVFGYPDGTFQPDKPITRAEISAIVSRFEKLAKTDKNPYADIDGNNWAYDYILSATEKGWFKGDNEGRFRPDDNNTRAEFVAVVNRVLSRHINIIDIPDGIHEFGDLTDADWAYADIIESLYTHNIRQTDKRNGEKWTEITGTGLEAAYNQ